MFYMRSFGQLEAEPEARYLFSPHSKQVRFPSPTQPASGREQEEVLSSLPTERQGDLDWDWP